MARRRLTQPTTLPPAPLPDPAFPVTGPDGYPWSGPAAYRGRFNSLGLSRRAFVAALTAAAISGPWRRSRPPSTTTR
jgi:hypothetical protein